MHGGHAGEKMLLQRGIEHQVVTSQSWTARVGSLQQWRLQFLCQYIRNANISHIHCSNFGRGALVPTRTSTEAHFRTSNWGFKVNKAAFGGGLRAGAGAPPGSPHRPAEAPPRCVSRLATRKTVAPCCRAESLAHWASAHAAAQLP